ncbi:hypothetical protein F5884DRAFT_779125 [Xylogone sp. PMI_703]|nr:hypothetical protein F5884DRAFT_779125 [Xylogone sp. PMI_703]
MDTLLGSDGTRRAVAVAQMTSLVKRERWYRDTAQWENLRNVYHPDGSKTSIKITWFNGTIDDFILRSVDMAGRGTHAIHTIQPVEISVSNDFSRAISESMSSIMIRFSYGSVQYDCTSWVRFISRFEYLENKWRMCTLDAIYIRDQIAPAIPGYRDEDQKIKEEIEIAGYRDSYKGISFTLEKSGFMVAQDLPGVDKPESVTEFMEQQRHWLK